MIFGKRKKRQNNERIVSLFGKCEELREAVSKMPMRDCLGTYQELRNGRWPDGISGKPDDWDSMQPDDRVFVLFDALHVLERRIPLKDRLRTERHEQYGESEEEFNLWWQSYVVELLQKIANRL